MTALVDKVALVTGAGRGIGREIALRLAADGAMVIINYAVSRDAAEAVAAEIASLGGDAIALQADVSKRAEVVQMFEDIDRLVGRLDIVVSSAGISRKMTLEELDESAVAEMIGVNMLGPLFVASEAAKRLGEGGRIINISSSIAQFPVAGASVYSGTKAAVRIFSETWAKELGSKGITVNSVSPGATSPGMMDLSPDYVALFEAASPFGRIGKAGEIASVVAFLASPEASWVSGAHILVNGAANI